MSGTNAQTFITVSLQEAEQHVAYSTEPKTKDKLCLPNFLVCQDRVGFTLSGQMKFSFSHYLFVVFSAQIGRRGLSAILAESKMTEG